MESFVSKFMSSSSVPATATYHSRTRSKAISKKFSPLLKLSQVPFLWGFMILCHVAPRFLIWDIEKVPMSLIYFQCLVPFLVQNGLSKSLWNENNTVFENNRLGP